MAGVNERTTVTVIGDGAVGLMAVLSAKRLGAQRIILMGRHTDRTDLGLEFGATDIVAERGETATEAVMAMTDGVGVDAALECVGTNQSMATAFAIARPGSIVGAIGVPHDVDVPISTVIFRNIGLRGGVAPVRLSRWACHRHRRRCRLAGGRGDRGGSGFRRSTGAQALHRRCRAGAGIN
jgi:threonine dehydrogenase-like Zn-dependent dehydrogenase